MEIHIGSIVFLMFIAVMVLLLIAKCVRDSRVYPVLFGGIFCILAVGGVAIYNNVSDMIDRAQERAYDNACRNIVQQNTEADVVATCTAHLEKIDAFNAALEAQRQAQRNKNDADFVRRQTKSLSTPDDK